MNLTISGHHLELTPAIREYVESKLSRIKRHFDDVLDITVILSVNKLTEKEKRQKVEINLHVKGKAMHAEGIAQDMYAAIDCLMDKLDRQVMQYKNKVQEHHSEVKRMVEAPVAVPLMR